MNDFDASKCQTYLDSGIKRMIEIRRFGEIEIAMEQQKIAILSGSFNPLHVGHIGMAKYTRDQLGCPVWFELSIHNVEKQSLDRVEIEKRVGQDFLNFGLLLSNTATFEEKAQLFRNALFVVGADTILRIDDPKYYRDESHLLETIRLYKQREISFLVCGRQLDGRFVDAKKLVRLELSRICEFVAEDEFDLPVSSTEIRKRRG